MLLLCYGSVLLPLSVRSDTTYSTNTYGRDSKQLKEFAADNGYWVTSPLRPGSDTPPIGHSLFDILFSSTKNGRAEHQIPFPFSVLLEQLGKHLDSSEDALKQVLIPIGRSLRRNAAAPDYFSSPRIVVTADGEPSASPGQAGVVLKGHLFLAYQEKSRIIEVISYNTQAGRFEFQEVENYGPGLIPEVKYARRPLCLSCHQNAGPIFPEEPWSETNANLQVAAKIQTVNADAKLNGPYAPRFDDAWAIDYSSDRANYFASSQLLWQQGCAPNKTTSFRQSVRCRGAMLKAVLHYRLIGNFNHKSIWFQQDFLEVVARNWRQKWPDGIRIATANIADKDPFSNATAPSQDPLSERSPRASWQAPSSHLLAGIIYQTADFFTKPDIQRIDQHLNRNSNASPIKRKNYHGICGFTRSIIFDSTQIVRFSCKREESIILPDFSASGIFTIKNNQITSGTIDRLVLGIFPEFRFLTIEQSDIIQNGRYNVARMRIREKEGSLGARFLDGTLLERLELKWPVAAQASDAQHSYDATFSTIENFAPLDDAIEMLVAESITGSSSALTLKPLRRHEVLKALHKHLGMTPLKWKTDEPGPKYFVPHTPSAESSSDKEQVLLKHCGNCHGMDTRFPPGFLHGTRDQVKQKVDSCTEQIFQRISMWDIDPQHRPMAPMPPPHWIRGMGYTESEWRSSDVLKQLQSIGRALFERSRSNSDSAAKIVNCVNSTSGQQ